MRFLPAFGGAKLNIDSPWQKFATATTAASFVEHAVLLALIVCGLFSLGGFAVVLTQPFSEVLTENIADTAHPRLVGHTPETVLAGGGERVVSSYAYRGIWIAYCLALLLLTFGGYCLLRRGRRRLHLEAPNEPDNLADMTAKERRCLFEKRQQILRVLRNNTTTLLQNKIQVRHLMSHKVLTVKTSTPLIEVRQLMKKSKIRHMLICGKRGQLVGVISDRDIRNRDGQTAADVMTSDPIVASPNDPVGNIITLMMHKYISCVPVVDDGNLCGILTSTDMMMSLHCSLQILAQIAADADIARRLELEASLTIEDSQILEIGISEPRDPSLEIAPAVDQPASYAS